MRKMETVKRHLEPRVRMGIQLINIAIVEFIILHKGDLELKTIEDFTGLNRIHVDLVANLLKLMIEEGTLSLVNGRVMGNVQKLKDYLKNQKVSVPAQHGRDWSDEDYVKMAEMRMKGMRIEDIAKELKRTVRSVSMQGVLLRKAYRLIPIIQNHTVLSDFVSIQKFPVPKDSEKE